MKNSMDKDAESLLRVLEYFPETGVLIWKTSRGPRSAGSQAGYLHAGYLVIEHRRRKYPVHRVAWLLTTGKWPTAEIDHINLDKLDNRWSNLRAATRSQNCANRRGWGKFPKGVKRTRHGTFEARFEKSGRYHHLGTFKTAEEAAGAYATAAKQYFGEFARIE